MISTPGPLRIASLLPSATEIAGALGLGESLVALTHCCDVAPDEAGMAAVLARGVPRVTRSPVAPDAMSQAEIDTAVNTSLEASSQLSLYALDETELCRQRPSVVLTQALCDVCAVSEDLVRRVFGPENAAVQIVSLSPGSLAEVGESFQAVADACGGDAKAVRAEFEHRIERVRSIACGRASPDASLGTKPSLLLLEWIDPPFDGGHWVPDQIDAAGCRAAFNASLQPSKRRTWDEISKADPDIIVVACCGFGLDRNLKDAQEALARQGSPLASLRAVRNGRLYAADGGRFFSKPAPGLAAGAALLARCAHDRVADSHATVVALEELPFLPAENVGWRRIPAPDLGHASAPLACEVASAPCGEAAVKRAKTSADDGAAEASFGLPGHDTAKRPGDDIEDIWQLHEKACAEDKDFYKDPATGYMVFTRVAHQRRGKCCGAGCRHCPYNHANVRSDRLKDRIQQPAFLHVGATERDLEQASSAEDSGVVVLFWSSGKDSFLTLRELTRSDREVVLLTTFDATSRVIANQEVHVSQVERQARHLDVSLVGVPLHPGVDYVDRLRAGLSAVQVRRKVAALAFGDLHLEHIRAWRDDRLSSANLGVPELLYPLWHAPYSSLHAELEAAGVPCEVSALGPRITPTGALRVGAVFSRSLAREVASLGMDEFGEKGEFHTLAKVWEVPSSQALGKAGL